MAEIGSVIEQQESADQLSSKLTLEDLTQGIMSIENIENSGTRDNAKLANAIQKFGANLDRALREQETTTEAEENIEVGC